MCVCVFLCVSVCVRCVCATVPLCMVHSLQPRPLTRKEDGPLCVKRGRGDRVWGQNVFFQGPPRGAVTAADLLPVLMIFK